MKIIIVSIIISPKFGITVRFFHSQAFALEVVVVVVLAGALIPFAEGAVPVIEEGAVPVVEQICPDEPSNIPSLFAVEVNHAPQSVCVKDDASENMSFMLVTLDTSHLEMSPLNDDATENMCAMSVTLDTSQLEILPLNDGAE